MNVFILLIFSRTCGVAYGDGKSHHQNTRNGKNGPPCLFVFDAPLNLCHYLTKIYNRFLCCDLILPLTLIHRKLLQNINVLIDLQLKSSNVALFFKCSSTIILDFSISLWHISWFSCQCCGVARFLWTGRGWGVPAYWRKVLKIMEMGTG